MFEEQVRNFINGFFSEGARILIEDVVSILPEVVGYTAMVAGAFIVLAPMIGQNIIRPLGIFAAVAIGSASILGAF